MINEDEEAISMTLKKKKGTNLNVEEIFESKYEILSQFFSLSLTN